ncbi:MAG: hypothetical protein JKY04_05875 [Sneathiella sp.]|nr:hypothetical protein [Sneathiella sp.]
MHCVSFNGWKRLKTKEVTILKFKDRFLIFIRIFLQHPAWTGIAGIVAIITLFSPFQTEKQNDVDDIDIVSRASSNDEQNFKFVFNVQAPEKYEITMNSMSGYYVLFGTKDDETWNRRLGHHFTEPICQKTSTINDFATAFACNSLYRMLNLTHEEEQRIKSDALAARGWTNKGFDNFNFWLDTLIFIKFDSEDETICRVYAIDNRTGVIKPRNKTQAASRIAKLLIGEPTYINKSDIIGRMNTENVTRYDEYLVHNNSMIERFAEKNLCEWSYQFVFDM